MARRGGSRLSSRSQKIKASLEESPKLALIPKRATFNARFLT
jgi:hypothetical protein